MEYSLERSESGSDSLEQDKSGNHNSEHDEPPEESEEPSDTAQNVLAAVRKLYDSFTGKPHPSVQSRTRSGRSIDHENSSIAFHGATHYDVSPSGLMRGSSDTTGEFDQPSNQIRTPTGARTSHHTRSPSLTGMAILEKHPQAGDGRSDRVQSMAGSRLPERLNSAGHKDHVQAQDRQDRRKREIQVSSCGAGVPAGEGYTLRGVVLPDPSAGEI